MRKVIVIGGAGFVGSAVLHECVAHGAEAWAVVRPGFSGRIQGSRLEGLPVHIVECDLGAISDLPSRISDRGFDVWYQFAWDGLAGDDLLDYKKQLANVKWVLDAIGAAAAIGCRTFVGAGSISQYELFAEGGQANAGDKHRIYKTAKLAAEYMGRSVAKEKGVRFIWPIITNIYGAGEKSPRLVNTMIRNLQSGRHQSLSEGKQIYDFVYIDDAAKAFRLIGEKGRENRVYVIASGHARPLREFLVEVRDTVAPGSELGFGEMNFNGIYLPKERYSTDALAEDTGFSADVSFSEGIRRTAEWIRDCGAG